MVGEVCCHMTGKERNLFILILYARILSKYLNRGKNSLSGI